jgi:NAD(P)-dependent dehydrogenase (short-subunit alcohol dehydrogenase family)
MTAARACEGRVALVTGASRGGTGSAVAVRLAAEGAAVALTSRTVDGLEETAARIDEVGGTALVVPCDLRDPHGVRASLVARVAAELGPVDILVNSAASNGYKAFETWTAAELDAIEQLNVRAPWDLMAQSIGSMRARGAGWIVNLTSFSGELPPGPPFPRLLPATGGSAYGASKAALNRLTVSVAGETYGEGIAVNALTPQAAIATPALLAGGWIDPALYEPLETMAEATLALCTCDASVLTGRIAYSLQLLAELDRPVRDLRGEELVEGWQPADLPAVVAEHTRRLERNGWPRPFDLGRAHSPPTAR